MSIEPITAAGATTPAASAIAEAGSHSDSLGSNAFLKLLVTQLQNQDPTSPQSNTEFIAQLATFSSLEQLTAINKAVSSMAQFLGDVDKLTDLTDAKSV